jgi:TolB-like protein
LPDIFLSYGHDDEITARRFAEGLERAGFSVWWDSSIRSGEAFDAAIERALADASAVVVLWSKTSVLSRWVRAEATLAERSKTLVPVMIEACQRPIMFELTHTADLSHWHGADDDKKWQALLVELRQRVAKGAVGEPAGSPGSGVRGSVLRPPESPSPGGHKVRLVLASLGTVAVLLIAGGSYWALTRGGGMPAARPAPVSAMPAPTSPDVPRASLAVMPFANLTGETSKEYFSDGMAEALINSLSHISGLKVPARTSSFAYKGRNVDIRRIAQDLGVAAILEGSVQSAGASIRVTAELVDGRTGYHLWSDSYDRRFADIFKLQDDLTAAIVQALRARLGATLPSPTTRPPPTSDVLAYQLYLQARAAELGEEADLRRGVALLDQAISRDPAFAQAYAVRASVRVLLLLAPDTPSGELVAAERDAQRALVLDPNLAEAHTALGIINTFRADWIEAEANFRKALAEDADDPFTHTQYAFEQLATGHLNQSHQEASEAYRLAPADSGTVATTMMVSTLLGLEAEVKKYTAILATLPGRGAFDNPRMSERLSKAGGAEVERLINAAGTDPARKRAASLALQNLVHRVGFRNFRQEEAREAILAFASLGAPDQAYALTNQMLDDFQHSGTLTGGFAWAFIWLPGMRDFRMDPRFQTFVARIHLPEYWQQYGGPDACDFSAGNLTCH